MMMKPETKAGLVGRKDMNPQRPNDDGTTPGAKAPSSPDQTTDLWRGREAERVGHANTSEANEERDDDKHVLVEAEEGNNSASSELSRHHDNTSTDDDSNSHNTTGKQHDRKQQRQHSPSTTKLWLLLICIVACLGVIVVAVAIPVLRNQNDYDVPRFQDTGFDVHEMRRASCNNRDCNAYHYGHRVKLSSLGTRLFVLAPENEQGMVEVWDESDAGTWNRRSQLLPHGGGTRDGVSVISIDDSGSRFIATWRGNRFQNDERVEVYEAINGTDTESTDQLEWNIVGESMDPFFLALDSNYFRGSSYREGNVTSAQKWGESVDISSDGNVIAVSAPDVSIGYNKSWVGLVRVLQHINTASPQQQNENPNSTWIPKGQLLVGDREDVHMGFKILLADNGNRLLVAHEHPFGCDGRSAGEISVYTYNQQENKWDKDRTNIVFSHHRPKSDLMAVSRNGRILAVAMADDDPSAYEDKPYRGRVNIYEYDTVEQAYELVTSFWGEEAFSHFGTSLAVSDRSYSIAIGTGDTNLDQDLGRMEVYDYSIQNRVESTRVETPRWNREVPIFGDFIRDVWESVAISADGNRVVGGAPEWNADFGETAYSAGLVKVYDRVGE